MAAPAIQQQKTVALTILGVKEDGNLFKVAAVDEQGEKVFFKMFVGSYTKAADDLTPNTKANFVIEDKGRNGQEDWFILWKARPATGGGYKGGGGVAKSDPAKNAVIEKANTRNNDTIREANIRNSITAIAVAGVTAIGEEAKDANALRAWVEDVHKTVEDLVREANGG